MDQFEGSSTWLRIKRRWTAGNSFAWKKGKELIKFNKLKQLYLLAASEHDAIQEEREIEQTALTSVCVFLGPLLPAIGECSRWDRLPYLLVRHNKTQANDWRPAAQESNCMLMAQSCSETYPTQRLPSLSLYCLSCVSRRFTSFRFQVTTTTTTMAPGIFTFEYSRLDGWFGAGALRLWSLSRNAALARPSIEAIKLTIGTDELVSQRQQHQHGFLSPTDWSLAR